MLNSVVEKDSDLNFVPANKGPNNTSSDTGSPASGQAVSPKSAVGNAGAAPTRSRVRMSQDERRKQLVAIGLKIFAERPIQEIPLDEVAAEAKISRGLLFHYFPTKSDFYREVVAAAGRRVARTVNADPDVSGAVAVEQMVDRFVSQIDRRRPAYLALVRGNLSDIGDDASATMGTLREIMTWRAADAMELPHTYNIQGIVHGWLAYVEDVTVHWTGFAPDRRAVTQAELVRHFMDALQALLDVRRGLPDVSMDEERPMGAQAGTKHAARIARRADEPDSDLF